MPTTSPAAPADTSARARPMQRPVQQCDAWSSGRRRLSVSSYRRCIPGAPPTARNRSIGRWPSHTPAPRASPAGRSAGSSRRCRRLSFISISMVRSGSTPALDLARTRARGRPARLAADVRVARRARPLPDQAELLRAFDLPIALMQDADALERVSAELIEAKAADNVRYVEIRWGRSLHVARGLPLADGIAAVCRGARRRPAGPASVVRLICTALRSHDPPTTWSWPSRARLPRRRPRRLGPRRTRGSASPTRRHAAPSRLLAPRPADHVHAGEWGGAARCDAPWPLSPSGSPMDPGDRRPGGCAGSFRPRHHARPCPTSNVQAGVVPDGRASARPPPPRAACRSPYSTARLTRSTCPRPTIRAGGRHRPDATESSGRSTVGARRRLRRRPDPHPSPGRVRRLGAETKIRRLTPLRRVAAPGPSSLPRSRGPKSPRLGDLVRFRRRLVDPRLRHRTAREADRLLHPISSARSDDFGPLDRTARREVPATAEPSRPIDEFPDVGTRVGRSTRRADFRPLRFRDDRLETRAINGFHVSGQQFRALSGTRSQPARRPGRRSGRGC